MLVLVLLAVRALIPVGYMPEAKALAAGKFLMTICLGTGGMKTVLVDASGDTASAIFSGDEGAHPSDDSGDSSMHQEQCAFGLLGVMVAMPAVWLGLVALLLGFVSAVAAALPVASPRSTPTGPPLGSRAPPTHLA
jgi:hypothetical protein